MADARDDRFTQFFSETREALRRYVKRMVRSSSVTDDIVQEAYLRTYTHGNTAETPRAFLFSIARNLALQDRRHERYVQRHSLNDSGTGELRNDEECPEESVLARERIELLRQAIESLPPQCRAALTLRVFHEYSYKEIAVRLGLSQKTVEKHIALGLRETHADLTHRYKDVKRHD